MIFWLLCGVAILTISLFSIIRYKWINLIIATTLFAIYFNVFSMPSLAFFIFMIGIILLVIELYIPNFGAAGLIGAISTIAALHLLLNDVTVLLTTIIYCVLVMILVLLIGFKLGFTMSLSPQFILTTSLNHQSSAKPQKDYQDLLGQVGVVIEDLRPVGKILLNDSEEIIEALSQIGMMKSGTHVVVNKVVGSKIYVKQFERVGE
ncbi:MULTISPECIES: NfeD family protein [unclassified Facklamia]|uniref:NfeD family protein n=1 Tax=Aerococcaceae TaxID=186827 RepID=UPI0013B84C22|nr:MULTISPECIES: NfeD family protein [unclassified Facklamia]NEW63694.1 hypothetical protein [Facklamia sp. 252]NEW67165.1 hypothetical protein [Facklamia sp. 253]QQD66294.1 hypothetical protein JDW14_04130 [Aerococcaceae bacterium zg-252]